MIPYGWRETVNKLKRKMPPPKPVSVITVKKIQRDEFGYTEFDGKRFKIVIERGCEHCMLWVLIHEWSHLFDHWHLGTQDHPDSIGAYYMTAYRIVFDAE